MTRPILLSCFIALVAALAPGCASSTRETTIKTALVTVDSARDGFLAYDRGHQMGLTAHCDPAVDSKEQCVAKVAASNAALNAYHVTRAKVDPLFGVAYRGIAAAELLNDDLSLTSMQAAIVQLLDGLKPFLGGK